MKIERMEIHLCLGGRKCIMDSNASVFEKRGELPIINSYEEVIL